MVLFTVTTLEAAPKKTGVEIRVTEKATPAQKQRAHELQLRLNEISEIDVHQLSAQEKAALKKEIREIKREARQMENVYIYFGGGFLLLLILLIILI